MRFPKEVRIVLNKKRFRFFLDLTFTAGNVLIDKKGDIVALAGITPTSTKESHMFKVKRCNLFKKMKL